MKHLGIVAMFAAVSYLIGVFISLEPDVRNWHEASRAALVTATLMMSALYWAKEGWE